MTHDYAAWLSRMPPKADALCVAGYIERNLPREAWAKGVAAAQDAGFEVDVRYLRDKWRIQVGAERRESNVTPIRPHRGPVPNCPQPESPWRPAA